MQRSGTEAIRTQIQPSKPKRETTNITNSQNTNLENNRVSSFFRKSGHSNRSYRKVDNNSARLFLVLQGWLKRKDAQY